MSYITPASVMSNILMYRKQVPNQAFLLVEGESDIGFYKNIINKKTCRIVSLSGKEKVEKALRILNAHQVKGVIAVIDKDYDALLGCLEEEDNLYHTDTHDVETMILKTGAFERFVNEFGNDDKIGHFENVKGCTVLEELLAIANKVGTLRFLNMKCKWGVGFRNVELNRCLTDQLELDETVLIDALLYHDDKKYLRQEITETLEQELNKGHDPWEMSRGHDLTQLIAIFFTRRSSMALGNTRAFGMNGRDVESAIRLAYREEDFETTLLYAGMMQWQEANKQWIVLE